MLFTVEFRYVVFRPFIGEVIEGELARSDRRGLSGTPQKKKNQSRNDIFYIVTLKFFNDILITPSQLPDGCEFRDADQVWVWTREGNEFWFDECERIKFRVIDETFTDTSPKTAPNTVRVDISLCCESSDSRRLFSFSYCLGD